MTPDEAAVAVRDIKRWIAEMRVVQAAVDDPLMLLRISVQLDNLRREQRYLIGLLTRDPLL